MNKEALKKQSDEYCETWQELNAFYEDYAKSVGHSYTSLQTLSIIASGNQSCTQTIICERTFLPKQTVNTIITGFLKQGIIQLVEVADNRRKKEIHLTEYGQQYTRKILPKLQKAELTAMGNLDEPQRRALISLTKLYAERLHKFIYENK